MAAVIEELEPEDPFFETPAGQFIVGAHCYLIAARELRYSETYAERQSVLVKPTLHVLAHGVELLLKFPMIRDGTDVNEIRKQFGHDLSALWAAPANENLRVLVRMSARVAWEDAKESGKWPDSFEQDPDEELDQKLAKLSELHGRDSFYALRYLTGPEATGPSAAFLIDAFGATAEQLAKDPSALDF